MHVAVLILQRERRCLLTGFNESHDVVSRGSPESAAHRAPSGDEAAAHEDDLAPRRIHFGFV